MLLHNTDVVIVQSDRGDLPPLCVSMLIMCQTNTLVCSTPFVKYYIINCQGVVSVDIQE